MLELRKQSQQEILSMSNPNSRSLLPAISWTLHLPPVLEELNLLRTVCIYTFILLKESTSSPQVSTQLLPFSMSLFDVPNFNATETLLLLFPTFRGSEGT